MGFFSGVEAAVRKSEAAVVIQKLLERQIACGLLEVEPRALANKLVQVVWDRNPQLFNDANAKLPNKLALAAAALSSGVNALRTGDRSDQLALVTCLGFVLMDLIASEGRHSLSSLDLYLIDQATSVHLHFSDQPSPLLRH